ncbi:MmcQ/YjbR family DNA-binding protein [Paenibacillus soyae]|uniref:MmcQ/YjbR family DNA-binding protein n=1 Tax=Paenibacillus soyae TaxID=2969249 RepID=A0A9X2SBD4_9BACL|nr:MmcQ/YjbR family DNA-binding protein [Paenibacillus soyae]MCR2806960.1 MmcQ/YjbR family DNA-binding protein [Paenibacillus soyae]
MKSEQGLDMLERVRGICASLPEVEEIVDGFGHDVMKVRGKTFIMMGDGEGKGLPGLHIKSDKEQQYLLLQQGGYIRMPYLGQHGWVSLDKEAEPDWDEIAGLIRTAYLLAAPKRLVKQVLESGQGGGSE